MNPNLSPTVSGRYLSFSEREDIAVWRAQDVGARKIARRLGRSPSTISRELRRNASTRSYRLEYRASTAQWHAERRARRSKPAKLAANAPLRAYVQDRLAGVIQAPDGTPVPGISADVRLDQHEECVSNGWVQVDDAFAATSGPTDAPQRGLSGGEFPLSGRHGGLTDTGGTGDHSDPAVTERPGFRPYQQATLPLIEVRQSRPEFGCQHSPLPFQPAHARPKNH